MDEGTNNKYELESTDYYRGYSAAQQDDDEAFLDQAMIAAMQGILSNPSIDPIEIWELASDSCNQAKALLEERNKMMGGGE